MVNPQKPTKPKVTPEEEEYRKELFPDVKQVKNKNLLCTSCGRSVKDLIGKGIPISHPWLGTLLCQKCDLFYGDGQFSEDEDGCDKYCRWCGQGGTLFLCSSCTAGFCKKCVKRNLPKKARLELDDDNWECYCCNPKHLFELRAQCWAAQKYAEQLSESKSSTPSKSKSSRSSKRKRDRENSDEEDKSSKKVREEGDGNVSNDEEVKSSKKVREEGDGNVSNDEEEKSSRSRRKRKSESKGKVRKSENGEKEEKPTRSSLREKKKAEDEVISGLPQSQWNIIIKKCDDVTSDVAKITKDVHKKILEFKVKKINLKHINTLESLAEVRKNVNEILSALVETSSKVKESFHDYCEEWVSDANKALDAKAKESEEGAPDTVVLENGNEDSPAAKMDVDESEENTKDKVEDNIEDVIAESSTSKVDEDEGPEVKDSPEIISTDETLKVDASKTETEESQAVDNSTIEENGNSTNNEKEQLPLESPEKPDSADGPEECNLDKSTKLAELSPAELLTTLPPAKDSIKSTP